ncbi:MAG: hypothetical protein JO270_02980 [Acidobacteriaceae bacterium]|nr:hypothetical protein [Acidobacteriaceae bacterium]
MATFDSVKSWLNKNVVGGLQVNTYPRQGQVLSFSLVRYEQKGSKVNTYTSTLSSDPVEYYPGAGAKPITFPDASLAQVATDLKIPAYPNGPRAARNPNTNQDFVPGYAYLGVGFNGFGSFDDSATLGMFRLFATSNPGSGTYQQWALPANVQADAVGELEVQSQVFDGRSDLSETFSTQAGLSATYLAFSGSLSASFKTISKRLSEYFFGMASYYTAGYEVSLIEATRGNLAPEMQQDPDFANLPQQYTPDNRAAFFRFFEKYGTAFVSSVRMGARLFYNAWIEKSYGMTEDQIAANLKLEYKGVFSASGSVDWQRVNQTWSSNRRSQAQSWGGDTSTLLGVSSPDVGESYFQQYSAWVASVNDNPAPVSFGLTEIYKLFSGEQAEAVKKAASDYRGGQIRVQSAPGSAGIQLNGTPVFPASNQYTGVGYAVIDSASLAILKRAVYPGNYPGFGQNPTYDQIASELAPYNGNSNVIVAMLFWGLYDSSSNAWGYPSASLHDVLIGLGAGEGFGQWGQPTGSGGLGTGGPSLYYQLSYAIVGVPGSPQGSAFEDFDFNTQEGQSPAVDLEVFLRPQSDVNNAVRYSLT